jgi:hypothetical protein
VPIGGDNPYPTVQEVTNLVRSQVQDVMQGAMLLPAAKDWANDQINDFLNEQTKREQGIPYPVRPFGEESIY